MKLMYPGNGLPANDTQTALLVEGGAGGGGGGAFNTTPPTYTDGQATVLQTDNRGNQKVVGPEAVGANPVGNPVRIGGRRRDTPSTVTDGAFVDMRMDPYGNPVIATLGLTAGPSGQNSMVGLYSSSGSTGTPLAVVMEAHDTFNAFNRPVLSGSRYGKIISAASTNATLLKSGLGGIVGIQLANTDPTNWAYLKLYNLTVAPTVGTSVPFDTIAIPPNGRVEISRPNNLIFATGLSYAITAGPADTDTAAVAANQVVGCIHYG